MHVVHISTSVNEWTVQLILFYPSLQLRQSFFRNIAEIKRVLDTEAMSGYHCFNFTEKRSYEV